MNRRTLLGSFLALTWTTPWLAGRQAQAAPMRRIRKIGGPFILVDGWVLNESDLPKLHRKRAG